MISSIVSKAWTRLSDFVAPVADDELPELRSHTLPAVRVVTLLLTGLSLIYWITHWHVQDVHRTNLTILCSVTILGQLAAHAWSQLGHGKRRPEAPLFFATLVLSFTAAATGWIHTEDHGTIAIFAPVIPLSVSSFLPWRPSYPIVLIGVATALVLLLARPLPIAPSALLFMAFSVAVTAGVSVQLQRRLRRRLVRATRALTSAERMSDLGRMTAGIAHELKTPLATANYELEGCRHLSRELDESIGHGQVTEDDLREIAKELQGSVTTLDEALKRANAFVRAIRGHTRMVDSDVTRFTVAERLEHVLTLLRHRLRKCDVHIDDTRVSATAGTIGDVHRFDQVLTNLLTNALDAVEDSGAGTTIRIEASEGEDGLRVAVQDDGPGVPAHLRERIFEPMFTTRPPPLGTGLGLAMSRDIVRASFGGDLVLVPAGEGARFELNCPHERTQNGARSPWLPSFAVQTASFATGRAESSDEGL